MRQPQTPPEVAATWGVDGGQARGPGANGRQAGGLGEWEGGLPVRGCGLLHPQESGSCGAALTVVKGQGY